MMWWCEWSSPLNILLATAPQGAMGWPLSSFKNGLQYVLGFWTGEWRKGGSLLVLKNIRLSTNLVDRRIQIRWLHTWCKIVHKMMFSWIIKRVFLVSQSYLKLRFPSNHLPIISGVHVPAEVLVEISEAVIEEDVSLKVDQHLIGEDIVKHCFVGKLRESYLECFLDWKHHSAGAGLICVARIFPFFKA